jgi:hypothetical protein
VLPVKFALLMRLSCALPPEGNLACRPKITVQHREKEPDFRPKRANRGLLVLDRQVLPRENLKQILGSVTLATVLALLSTSFQGQSSRAP